MAHQCPNCDAQCRCVGGDMDLELCNHDCEGHAADLRDAEIDRRIHERLEGGDWRELP